MAAKNSSFSGLVPRPPFQLRSLPIEIRWEVTRRHPYYQRWWKSSRSHHRSELPGNAAEPFVRQAAVQILGSIDVNGEPPDPVTSFSDLGESNLKHAWLSGAVHPITLGGMAAMLLTGLPKQTLNWLGMLFFDASCDEPDDGIPKVISSLMRLQSTDKPGLNKYSVEPFVSINPAASGRQVNDSVSKLLKERKEQRDLTEQRDRSDKYPIYLNAWDRREGWTGASYDLSCESLFREIAKETKEKPSTVSNHYRRAFELIIGYPYEPELWWRTMGAHKVVEFDYLKVAVGGRRPTKSPTRRPVPESTLNADLDVLHHVQDNQSDSYSDTDLLFDLRTLIDEGHDDMKIKQILEFPEDDADCGELIEWVRSRDKED